MKDCHDDIISCLNLYGQVFDAALNDPDNLTIIGLKTDLELACIIQIDSDFHSPATNERLVIRRDLIR